MNRKLPEGFDTVYFEYLENSNNSNTSFNDILEFLNSKYNHRIDTSFSSKLLATIDPKMPVWDRNVSQSLDKIYNGKEIFKLDDYRYKRNNTIKGNSPEKKMENAINLYENLQEIQKDMLNQEEVISEIDNFRNYYKEHLKKILCIDEKYSYVKNYVKNFDFTNEKILDLFLWKL